jgi:hypothetical protein
MISATRTARVVALGEHADQPVALHHDQRADLVPGQHVEGVEDRGIGFGVVEAVGAALEQGRNRFHGHSERQGGTKNVVGSCCIPS